MLMFGIVLLAQCCKPDNTCSDPSNPECENYDPCYGKTDIRRADFLIETTYTIPGQIVYVTDTIFGYNLSPLRFKSVDDSLITNHIWYVGSEILTTDEVIRDFNNVPRPSDITVSHVVTYQNLNPCDPLDDGRDSVAVTFRLVGSYWEFLSVGTFRGSHNGSPESTFSIIPITAEGDTSFSVYDFSEFRFTNFHNTGEVADYFDVSRFSFTIIMDGTGSSSPVGRMFISADSTVRIDYRYDDVTTNWVFTGQKLN